jgi:hypothetical protein
MSQTLLREYFELCEGGICRDLLTEDEKKMIAEKDIVILSGKIQQADTKNGNGRSYPEKILRREIERYQQMIQENRALGELDHPESSVINLKNVSHLVTKTWWDGPAVMAKIRVLETPSGQILKSLIRSGVKLGISSRGLGSTHQAGGVTMVDDDFQLICFDMVSEPSTPGAFMMKEARDRQLKVQKLDRLNEIVNKIIGGKNG